MSQHGVNDLPTTELTLNTLRLSKAQKHALYTLIASVRPELTIEKLNTQPKNQRTAYSRGHTQATQDYDNAIKALFDAL